MAQLDGVVLTFTSTIMVFSSLQPLWPELQRHQTFRCEGLRGYKCPAQLVSLSEQQKKLVQGIHFQIVYFIGICRILKIITISASA